ncbi:MAG: hypothetical protein F6K24_51185 [Okeania sp. SIO2D1]|nr:hypothetical protein [Okeania sp. SIO2D1]
MKKEERRRKKEEGRRKKEEGRRKKEGILKSCHDPRMIPNQFWAPRVTLE